MENKYDSADIRRFRIMKICGNIEGKCEWTGVIKLASDQETKQDEHIAAILRYIRFDKSEIYPVAYLSEIGTDEDFRHRGYGTKGLMDFENESKKCGAKILLAWAMDSETPDEVLTDFYEKSGWTIVERHPPGCALVIKYQK